MEIANAIASTELVAFLQLDDVCSYNTWQQKLFLQKVRRISFIVDQFLLGTRFLDLNALNPSTNICDSCQRQSISNIEATQHDFTASLGVTLRHLLLQVCFGRKREIHLISSRSVVAE